MHSKWNSNHYFNFKSTKIEQPLQKKNHLAIFPIEDINFADQIYFKSNTVTATFTFLNLSRELRIANNVTNCNLFYSINHNRIINNQQLINKFKIKLKEKKKTPNSQLNLQFHF